MSTKWYFHIDISTQAFLWFDHRMLIVLERLPERCWPLTYSRILNSLKQRRYHKIWELRKKKRDYFSTGISGMWVGPSHRSFESTLLSSFGTLLMIRLVPGYTVWGHSDFLFAACLVKYYYNSHSIWLPLQRHSPLWGTWLHMAASHSRASKNFSSFPPLAW